MSARRRTRVARWVLVLAWFAAAGAHASESRLVDGASLAPVEPAGGPAADRVLRERSRPILGDPAASLRAAIEAGAMTRRMAVHFWPALLVISRVTSLMNRSNSGVPGTASGPRIDALRESVSAVK